MTFASIIYQAHSGWRYIVIIAAIIALTRLLYAWIRGAEWQPLDRWLGMAYITTMDIQFLLGAVLWIRVALPALGANPTAAWEHPVTMLISIAVAHISWSRARRTTASRDKFRVATIGFLVSGLVLALGIVRITSTLG